MESISKQEVSISIRVDSRLDQVHMVGYAVHGICSQLGLGDIVVYQIELAVVEAVNNAIKHAYGSVAGHPVEVVISLNEKRLQFEICDEGETLHFLQKKAGLDFDPRNKTNLPEGGMGLHIIAQVMDDVNYFVRDGRNCLVLCKGLSK
ncbi:MAG TPA: ATP-binding protein [Syntrophus sp. (in: bacteria)]|jgi:serine/threonine-protein kinase RsbW|nr:ATP-binding protein [Syntrophus sp. (in: bacteria)]